jgi:hypothetical protein
VSAQEQWQLDGAAPELHQRYLVPAITALWAADLTHRAASRHGERVLDSRLGVECQPQVADLYRSLINVVLRDDRSPCVRAD